MPRPWAAPDDRRHTVLQEATAGQSMLLSRPASPPAPDVRHEWKGATILLIDDEDPLRFVIRTVLEREGFAVVEARDGREGIEEYHRARTDMVILDLLLPDIDGVDVLVELSWDDPQVKILAITGGSGPFDFLDVAEKFGARRVLKKPFDPDTLVLAVEEVLHGAEEP